MDVQLRHVKRFPKEIQQLVFGYVRNGYADTPDLILFTILAFYHIDEHFEEYSDKLVKVSEDGMTLTVKKISFLERTSSFGKKKVLTKHGGRVRWTIKINNFLNFCVIGIDAGQHNVNDAFWSLNESVHYAWAADDGQIRGSDSVLWRKFSSPCTDGDVVCMELDVDRNTLSFAINGGEMKIAFNDVKATEIGYSLAVYMFDENDSVSLVSVDNFPRSE